MGLQKFLLGFVEVIARQRSPLGELSVSFVCLPQDFFLRPLRSDTLEL